MFQPGGGSSAAAAALLKEHGQQSQGVSKEKGSVDLPRVYTHDVGGRGRIDAQQVVKCANLSNAPESTRKAAVEQAMNTLKAHGFVVLESLFPVHSLAPLEAAFRKHSSALPSGFIAASLRAGRTQIVPQFQEPWNEERLVCNDIILELVARYVCNNDAVKHKTEEQQKAAFMEWASAGANPDHFITADAKDKSDVRVGLMTVVDTPPSCDPQVRHRDIILPGPCGGLSVCIPLSAPTLDNGPLAFLSGSHMIKDPAEEVVACPPLGSVVVYDAFTQKREIENKSQQSRATVQMTFQAMEVFTGYTPAHFGTGAIAHTLRFRRQIQARLKALQATVRSEEPPSRQAPPQGFPVGPAPGGKGGIPAPGGKGGAPAAYGGKGSYQPPGVQQSTPPPVAQRPAAPKYDSKPDVQIDTSLPPGLAYYALHRDWCDHIIFTADGAFRRGMKYPSGVPGDNWRLKGPVPGNKVMLELVWSDRILERFTSEDDGMTFVAPKNAGNGIISLRRIGAGTLADPAAILGVAGMSNEAAANEMNKYSTGRLKRVLKLVAVNAENALEKGELIQTVLSRPSPGLVIGGGAPVRPGARLSPANPTIGPATPSPAPAPSGPMPGADMSNGVKGGSAVKGGYGGQAQANGYANGGKGGAHSPPPSTPTAPPATYAAPAGKGSAGPPTSYAPAGGKGVTGGGGAVSDEEDFDDAD